MADKLLSCTVCQERFRHRSTLKNHVEREHQASVRVTFANGITSIIKKGSDDSFKCNCGQTFSLPNSLRRHAKGCVGDIVDITMATGDAVMDRDATENEDNEMEVDTGNDVIPFDCISNS